MDDWIQYLTNLIPGPIKDFGNGVVARIAVLWSTVTTFFGTVRNGWTSVRNAATSWVERQLAHALAVALTFQWVISVFVPREVLRGTDIVRRWVTGLIQSAVATARAELAQVRGVLAGLIGQALAGLQSLGTWARSEIGTIRNDLTAIKTHLFGPLGTADRLVAWIIDPLVHALTAWAKDNAVRLGRILVAQRVRIFTEGLALAEDIVSRII